jgi:hypothetical protein
MSRRIEIIMGATLLEHLSSNQSHELPKHVMEAIEQTQRRCRTELPVEKSQPPSKPVSEENRTREAFNDSTRVADVPIEKPQPPPKRVSKESGTGGASTSSSKAQYISDETIEGVVVSTASAGALVGTVLGAVAAGPIGAVFFLV